MDSLITDINIILPMLPLIVLQMTNFLKWDLRGRWVSLIPYGLSITLMLLLWITFNEQSIRLYVVNGVVIAYTATRSYSETKQHVTKRVEEEAKEFESLDLNLSE